MPWMRRSCTSENRRFWCSGLQRLISSISTDCAPQTVAGVSRNFTPPRFGVRVGKADEIVEGDQAGVVMAVLEPERLGQAVQQEGLPGARIADEQQRVLGDQRREHDRFDRVETEHAERGEVGRIGSRHQHLLFSGFAETAGAASWNQIPPARKVGQSVLHHPLRQAHGVSLGKQKPVQLRSSEIPKNAGKDRKNRQDEQDVQDGWFQCSNGKLTVVVA